MGSDNLVLLPQTPIRATARAPRQRACLPAYLAYAAYVENGMAMWLRHNRKMGCYRC